MKTTKLFFCFLMLTAILFSCKKNEDTSPININYLEGNNYDYKIILTADNKVREVVVSYNYSTNYKQTYQYFNKYFTVNVYIYNNNLIVSKYYYLNDSNRVDSSTFFGISTSSSKLNDTTYSYYKYTGSVLSEVDYKRYYSSVYSLGGGRYDTTHVRGSGFKSYESSSNKLTSDMNGSTFYYSNIKNKLGLSMINFDQKQNIDFGFNVPYFGNQEEFLISEIHNYGSTVNVTKFSYTIDSNGFISKIEKTFPQFDYQKYEINYYKTIYNFTYSYE